MKLGGCVAQRIPRRIEFILIKDFKPNFPKTQLILIRIPVRETFIKKWKCCLLHLGMAPHPFFTALLNSVETVNNSCFPKFRNIVDVICLIGKLVILYDSVRPTFSIIRMFQKVQLIRQHSQILYLIKDTRNPTLLSSRVSNFSLIVIGINKSNFLHYLFTTALKLCLWTSPATRS